MGSRPDLQTMLEKLLGSRNVYFQPPASVKMKYPAIVYSLGDISNNHANDNIYIQFTNYNLTVIDEDPDSEIVGVVSKLPRCRMGTHFASDGLNHYPFTLYY